MNRHASRAPGSGLWFALLLITSACGGSSQVESRESAGADGGLSGEAGGGAERSDAGASSSNAGTSASSGAPGAAGPNEDGKTPCYGGCATQVVRPKPTTPPQCPTREPSTGSACAHEALRCSFGDSRTAQCRHIYQCTSGAWQADTSISNRYSCDPLPADYCPAESHHQRPCTIANVGMPCAYGELSCVCFARDPAPGKAGNWLCFGPPANPECPAIAPNLGAGCNPKGLACNYDGDACEAAPNSSLFCFDGAWEQGEGYNCAI